MENEQTPPLSEQLISNAEWQLAVDLNYWETQPILYRAALHHLHTFYKNSSALSSTNSGHQSYLYLLEAEIQKDLEQEIAEMQVAVDAAEKNWFVSCGGISND